ncbi:MAG TPA: DUF6119 family protein [Acidimicrobiales bacterium]|nr:DUF6119 family protein [Acidimicrobiales bacterium]
MPERIGSQLVEDFTDVVDLGDFDVTTYGPIEATGFRAQLYVINRYPHEVRWAGFLRQGFGDEVDIARTISPAALLLVELGRRRQRIMFAFPFGIAGRFLLRSDGYERGYGLRTALNLLYPRSALDLDLARLKAVDSKRHGPTIVRSRAQASESSTFETFAVNQLRDVVSKATGVPADRDSWGPRVGGGDALVLGIELNFDQVGELCRRIEEAHARDDYKDHFDWIDFVQPITDPMLKHRVENEVVDRLHRDDIDDLDLAPPEVVDWDHVAFFHYHFDRPQGARGRQHRVTHSDLRLSDYLTGLRSRGYLDDLGIAYLRQHHIRALEPGGQEVHRWQVWQCLVGQLTIGGDTYILDEGELFRVRKDYVDELDEFVRRMPESSVHLPPSLASLHEGDYNARVADQDSDFVLLDKKTVRTEGRTTPVEICDLLTRARQLVHVKRHLGSSNLSHLFAQGVVSAELLQTSSEFLVAANKRTRESSSGRLGFDFFDTPSIVPRDFEVVYAIIERWNNRTMSEALPFFSKVNLREAASNLRSRGFRVSLKQVPVA